MIAQDEAYTAHLKVLKCPSEHTGQLGDSANESEVTGRAEVQGGLGTSSGGESLREAQSSIQSTASQIKGTEVQTSINHSA